MISRPNPLKTDPTRTKTQRRLLQRDINRRFAALQREITDAIDEQDVFGLRKPVPGINWLAINTVWRFLTQDQKLDGFMRWLRGRIAITVLAKYALTTTPEDHWLQEHIERTFRGGMGRVFDYLKKPELQENLDFYRGTREQFLRDSFTKPVAIERVKLLASRTFNELQGVTEAMATQMQRTLTDGFIRGDSPRTIARQLNKDIAGYGKMRSERTSRTEIVRTMNEGQLLAMEEMGVEDVEVSVEWSTSGLGLTARANPSPCKVCAPLAGVVLKLKEARGLLPRHPNCFLSGEVRISVPGGWRYLRDVVVGDMVLTHLGRSKRVIEVHRNRSESERVVEITIRRPGGFAGSVVMTAGHPVMINGGWAPAEQVELEDAVGCFTGEMFTDFWVSGCHERTENNVRLYNLSVADDESYVAEGLIVHNCMCSYVPAGVGESTKGQKRTRTRIKQAIDRSISAERPKRKKRSLEEQRKRTSWAGSQSKISKKRPEPIV